MENLVNETVATEVETTMVEAPADVTVIEMPETEETSTGALVASVIGIGGLAVGGAIGVKKFVDSRLDKIISGEKETDSAILTGLAAMRAKKLEKKALKKAKKEAEQQPADKVVEAEVKDVKSK